ncbi:hypothetical protein [Streptomyces cavernae]|uniref:hypothetical protein n=1 Tax=Streptomyces cavernae TaxID=2259034 RepID=UPI000FEBD503|nr:hypothetical protein [Streptomyces cavernae]
MFHEIVTHADGSTGHGTATEAYALSLLRKAVRRDCRMEATRTGGIVITRDLWRGRVVPDHHIVALEPAKPVNRLTPAVRRDLEAVLAAPDAYVVNQAEQPFRARVGRLWARFVSLAPGTVARLVEGGLLVLGEPYAATSNGFLSEQRRPVRVSLAARLAMGAQAHRTRTTEPNGYVHAADIGLPPGSGRNVGQKVLVYDASSAVGCSCRSWSKMAEHRDVARLYVREHREQMTRELVV